MKKWILFFLCFFLVGCDFKEIRNLSIVSTMGIDFEDGKYKINVITISKEEGESKLYEGEGNSFFKAIQAVNDKLTEELYLGHMQNVIVSETVSKNGLKDVLNYFIKEDVIQNNFYLFLIQDSLSKDVLTYLMENSGYTLSNIFKGNNMLSLKKNNNSIHTFIQDMKDEHKDPVIHSLSLYKHSLSLHSLALFKEDKLVGFTDINGYYLLKGNVNQIYLSFPCGKKETTFSIDHMKFRTSISKNTVIHHISGDISMKENGCDFKMNTNDDMEKIKKDVQKVMQKKINTFLEDQNRLKIQSIDYKSFFLNKKYNDIKCKISLHTNGLKERGELHE